MEPIVDTQQMEAKEGNFPTGLSQSGGLFVA
jgi:hypothetical protein